VQREIISQCQEIKTKAKYDWKGTRGTHGKHKRGGDKKTRASRQNETIAGGKQESSNHLQKLVLSLFLFFGHRVEHKHALVVHEPPNDESGEPGSRVNGSRLIVTIEKTSE
jgi:hypothetical protein